MWGSTSISKYSRWLVIDKNNIINRSHIYIFKAKLDIYCTLRESNIYSSNSSKIFGFN